MKKNVLLLLITLGFMSILTGFGLFMLNSDSTKVLRANNAIIRDDSNNEDDDFVDENEEQETSKEQVSKEGTKENKEGTKENKEGTKENNNIKLEVNSNGSYGKFNLSKEEVRVLESNDFVSLADIKKSSSSGNEMIDELLRTADDFLRNADIDAQTIEEVKQMISYIKKKNYEFVLNGKKSLSVDIESPYKDEGYVCKINNKDCSSYVVVENGVRYDNVGTYYINYYLVVGDTAKKLTRTVRVTNAKGYILTVSEPDPTSGSVGMYFKSTLAADKFKSITLPNDVEVTTPEFGYWAHENGDYKFILNKTDGTNKPKTVTVSNIDRRNNNTPAPAYTYTYGNIIKNYNSNTLKYTITEANGLYLTYIWVSNPYRQMGVALAGYPTGLAYVSDTMAREIPASTNRAYVAVNASTFVGGGYNERYYEDIPGWYNTTESSYLINRGVVIHNYSEIFDRNNNKNLGLAKDGYLKDYAFSAVNDSLKPSELASNIERNRGLITKMNNDGIINSFTAFATVLSKKGAVSNKMDIAARTGLCQVDRNNFILLSTRGCSYNEMGQTFKNLGCYVGYNLDGGGSTSFVYQSNGTQVDYYRDVLGSGLREVADALYFTE